MTKDKIIQDTELILNPDGTIYHLNIKPENLADQVILVGDPGRVKMVSNHFDRIDFQGQNREFVIHTGSFRGKQITAMSTGMGTDNIDIVMNELDALVNIDLEERKIRHERKSLNLFRLGTSGAIQSALPLNAVVVAAYGLGLDGMLYFYDFIPEQGSLELRNAFMDHLNWDASLPSPYIFSASQKLQKLLRGPEVHLGITATAPGFYGPQGRTLRLPLAYPEINERLQSFRYGQFQVLNYEMETSALYGLSSMLGHHAISVCLTIANRKNREMNREYHPAMEDLTLWLLNRIVELKD